MYKIILSSDNWQLLNWLYSKINDDSDYKAVALNYLNIGESMISELEIFYFQNADFARDFVRAICGYWGKSLDGVFIRFEDDE